MSAQKNWVVKIGDFFFKWRNLLFPIILVSLFLLKVPPPEYFGMEGLEDIKDIMAVLLILAGLGFRAATIGWAYIKRGGVNKKVYADTLVMNGYFGMCRNPLYVGNMMIYSGIFIQHGHPLVAATGITLFALIYVSLIAAEEFFLREKFGMAFEAYCENVPRWIPDFSRYKDATKDMEFSFRRVIFKDYTTIFNTILASVFIELIEHYVYYPPSVFNIMAKILAAIIIILGMCTITVKYLKKREAAARKSS